MTAPKEPPPNYPKIPVEEPRVPLRDVQSALTGYLGLVVLFGGMALIWFDVIPRPQDGASDLVKTLYAGRWAIILLALTATMVAVELFVVRVYRRHFDFGKPRTMDSAARGRVMKRWAGIVAMLAAAWLLYSVIDLYRLDRFLTNVLGLRDGRPKLRFWSFFEFMVVGSLFAAVVGPLYFWVTEKYSKDEPQDEDDDELILAYRAATRAIVLPGDVLAFLVFGLVRSSETGRAKERVLGGYRELTKTVSHPNFKNLVRWGFVKFFFLPWMLVWCLGNCNVAQDHVLGLRERWEAGVFDFATAEYVYGALLNLIFLTDLAYAMIGYTLTVKILDTHVKSADPTFLGWAVALACYPPFNDATRHVFSHGSDGQWLKTVGGQVPLWLFVVWGIAILVLMAIYSWATVMFGVRFSNLTNRGILSKGPYAVIRHPAYVTKNLAWWLMSVPFLRYWVPTLALVAWNIIYIMRANTEEQHLMNDPHYREYCEKVRWKFIPGLW